MDEDTKNPEEVQPEGAVPAPEGEEEGEEVPQEEVTSE